MKKPTIHCAECNCEVIRCEYCDYMFEKDDDVVCSDDGHFCDFDCLEDCVVELAMECASESEVYVKNPVLKKVDKLISLNDYAKSYDDPNICGATNNLFVCTRLKHCDPAHISVPIVPASKDSPNVHAKVMHTW